MKKNQDAAYDNFDELAETYDESLKEILGGGKLVGDTNKFAEYKVQLLKCLCHPKRDDKILDFGCGTGRSLFYLNKYFGDKGVKLFGCDVSRESLKTAKKIVPSATLFPNEPIEELENYGAVFDIVMCACVFHHIAPEDRHRWINAIKNKLNTGGKIIIFEHNVINPFTRRIVNKPENPDDITWMLNRSKIIDLLLRDSSMRLVWQGYTLFSPWRPSWATQMERCLKWLPLGAQQCVVAEKSAIN